MATAIPSALKQQTQSSRTRGAGWFLMMATVVALAVLMLAQLLPVPPQLQQAPGGDAFVTSPAFADVDPTAVCPTGTKTSYRTRGDVGNPDPGLLELASLSPGYFPPDSTQLEDGEEWALSICLMPQSTLPGGQIIRPWRYLPGGEPTAEKSDDRIVAEIAAEASLLAQARNEFDVDGLGAPIFESSPGFDRHLYVGEPTWLRVHDLSWNEQQNQEEFTDEGLDVTITATLRPIRTSFWFAQGEEQTCQSRGRLPGPGEVGRDANPPCGFTPVRPEEDMGFQGWVEYELTYSSSLNSDEWEAPAPEIFQSEFLNWTWDVQEVQGFGIEDEGVAPPAAPAEDRQTPLELYNEAKSKECKGGWGGLFSPSNWRNCAEALGDFFVELTGRVADGVKFVVEATGDFIIEAGTQVWAAAEFAVDVASTAYDIVDGLANGVRRVIGYLKSLLAGCWSAITDAIGQIVGIAKDAIAFLRNPAQFVEDKLGQIKTTIESVIDDPGGALLAFLEWDLLRTDPIQWIAKKGCEFIIEALKSAAGAGLASLANKILDKLGIPRRSGTDVDPNDNGTDFCADGTRRPCNDDEPEPDLCADGTPRPCDDDPVECTVPSSFPTGTEVLMANGERLAIERIRPGDMVVAYNTDSETWAHRQVTNQWSYLDTDEMATITVDDGSKVSATDHHLFWVDDQGQWVEAEDLQPGDHLLTPTGVTTVIDVELWDSNPTLVWELTVAVDHTFTVTAGPQDVLVHNQDGGELPTPADIEAHWNNHSGTAADWFDSLSVDQVEAIMTGQPRADYAAQARRLTDGLRSGEHHEFFPVSRALEAKQLGLSSSDVRGFSVPTTDLIGIDPNPPHDVMVHVSANANSSTAANAYHQDLFDAIDDLGPDATAQDALDAIHAVNEDWGISTLDNHGFKSRNELLNEGFSDAEIDDMMADWRADYEEFAVPFDELDGPQDWDERERPSGCPT